MRKSLIFVLICLVLVSSVFSQEWVGTDSEFTSEGDDSVVGENSFFNEWLFLILAVLIVFIVFSHLRKINKGKKSVKSRGKKR